MAPRVPSSFGASDFFEMSLDLLSVAGFDGYMKRVNASWTRTLGWTAAELLARPSIDFVHPDDRERTLAARARLKAGEDMGPLVNRYLCKDGTFRWFEWRSAGDLAQGVVYAAARDITEQKRNQEQLARAHEREAQLQRQLMLADRMASVGTLAAGVAHEINNPLSYVGVNIAMILEALEAARAELPPKLASELLEMAVDVQTGAQRIEKIVRALKTFARAEEERLVPVDVTGVLDFAVKMTFAEIRHRARLVKDYGKTPLALADEGRLGQVFINLLVNAAQALREDAAATNEIRIVTAKDEEGRVVVEVHDNGVGIPQAFRGRVFDPFFTTKPIGVGTGLGLFVCHNIVTAHGGTIALSSEEGRGTTVRVVLPRANVELERPRSTPPSAAPLPASGPRARVLVVDDDAAVGHALKRALREHDVTLATSAADALAHLAAAQFDVIFSDLMMPDASGMELFATIEQRFPEAAARVVFVSGGAFTRAAIEFLDRVPNERIHKPFDPETIREIVRSRLVREGGDVSHSFSGR